MNRIEEYMKKPYKMTITQDENGIFTLYFPDLPGCITTGETPGKVLSNALDAKREWFKACIENGMEIPEPSTRYASNRSDSIALEMIRHDAREEGRSEGLIEGRIRTIIEDVLEGDYSLEKGAERAGMTIPELKDKAKEYGYEL